MRASTVLVAAVVDDILVNGRMEQLGTCI